MLLSLIQVLIYLFIGFFAGIIGGLLGIGGGVITVPCFFIIFSLMGYPSQDIMALSVGTSLAAMVFNSLSATWAHHRRHVIKWEIFKKMAPGLILGSLVGASLTVWLPERILEIFFGVFLCLLSFIYFRDKLPIFDISENIKGTLLRMTSIVIGILSSILGIGGGILAVPLLMSIKLPDKNAIGTSSSVTLLVSTIGTLSYIFFGWNEQLGVENIGYVNLPTFLIVGLATLFAAPIGVKLTHQIPLHKIRKIFASVLVLTGLTFIILNFITLFR